MTPSRTRIGTAGWALSSETAAAFPGEGRHIERYARVLDCAEINSSFHRSHRIEIYRRWAAQTPPSFRFSVKLPRSITHEGRLRRAREPLRRFLDEAGGLGDRLAVLLVQLPPSFAFEARPVRRFFDLVAGMFGGSVVCEPRHASWFTPAADRALAAARVARAAADPARWPEASRPGGWLGPDGDGRGAVLYHRWHGAPRVYWSRYEAEWLRARADELARWPEAAQPWCIFDNTASGAAIANALELRALLAQRPPAPPTGAARRAR
ncbi:MAG TPA: DUF72 domain-containing protein [Caldimonas sp.]|nr:DUF72 domain-containing protein [Caldimonas sp.]HEX2543081.1 DUF72 domain-containing protein [Caldimonas sp.]